MVLLFKESVLRAENLSHVKVDCKGEFHHTIVEDVWCSLSSLLPPLKLKFASYLVCDDKQCATAYYTEGFERFVKTHQAQKLMDKKEALTAAEKKFLRLYFEGLAWR